MSRTRAGSPVAWWCSALVAVVRARGRRAAGRRRPHAEERIDAIASTVKCPICQGESVYESRNSVAHNIKDEIARQVGAGQTDDQIRAGLVGPLRRERAARAPGRAGSTRPSGCCPVAVLVAAVAGLVLAFRRWRRDTAAPPTDEDRAPRRGACACRQGVGRPTGRPR